MKQHLSAPHPSAQNGRAQELLFANGLPSGEITSAGFPAKRVAAIAGISYRQLDYWARTELLAPSIQNAHGSGSARIYSFRDVLVTKLIKNFIDMGVSLQRIRKAVGQLHEIGVEELSEVTLMSDGASIYMCTTGEEVIDLLQSGQGVFGIAVGKVLRQVEADLTQLHREENQHEDELAARRIG